MENSIAVVMINFTVMTASGPYTRMKEYPRVAQILGLMELKVTEEVLLPASRICSHSSRLPNTYQMNGWPRDFWTSFRFDGKCRRAMVDSTD